MFYEWPMPAGISGLICKAMNACTPRAVEELTGAC